MKKPRWLSPRPGYVHPDIAVFVDEQETEMFLGKPVEVRVDAKNKIVYVWMKVKGYEVKTKGVGGALDGLELSGGISIPPWPDER